MRARAEGFYDKEGFCAAVVCAVEDGTDRQTEGESEFIARSSRACVQRNEDKKKVERGGVNVPRLDIVLVDDLALAALDDIRRMWRQSCIVYRHLPLCHVLLLFLVKFVFVFVQ